MPALRRSFDAIRSGTPALLERHDAEPLLIRREAAFTSPRVRGEVGSRSDPGEGAFPRV